MPRQIAHLTVRRLLDEAHAIAYAEVERRARQALRNRPGWMFCMAMGSASFSLESDHYDAGNARRWMQPTLTFIEEFDHELRLTGSPLMLKSADGPRLTDW